MRALNIPKETAKTVKVTAKRCIAFFIRGSYNAGVYPLEYIRNMENAGAKIALSVVAVAAVGAGAFYAMKDSAPAGVEYEVRTTA